MRKQISSVALIMMHATSAFLMRAPRAVMLRPVANLMTSCPSKLDDLMDEVLNSQNFTASAAASATANAAPHQGTISNSASVPSMNSTCTTTTGWRTIDWETAEVRHPTPPSPVDIIMVRDRLVYLKRDDQLRLPGSQISGNKARKMLVLNELDDFPTCLVSYGGPQSNAMLALAAVVHFQNQRRAGLTTTTTNTDDHNNGHDDPRRKRFVYYTKKLPRFLRNQPSGNLFRALALGMELRELSPLEYNDLFGGDFGGSPVPPLKLSPPVPADSVWVPQGGACGIANAGTRLLAQEIVAYWAQHGRQRPLSVLIPGGTCSTALLVHQAIQKLLPQQEPKMDIQVVVIPCVGDEGYARRQMLSLNTQTNGEPNDIPSILPPAPDNSYFGQPASGKDDRSYFRFGEPDPAILEVYQEMKDESQVLLDLLYGAPAWAVLLRHWRSTPSESPLTAGREIMYVHSGGMEGINSQLLRYQYKGLIDMESIQQPGRRRGGS